MMDSEKVLSLFKQHGFKVAGARVFITERQVRAATESAPTRFGIRARNPEKNLAIGDGDPVLCGTGGEVYIAEKD